MGIRKRKGVEKRKNFLRNKLRILSPSIHFKGLEAFGHNPQALRSEMRNRSNSHSWALRMLESKY